MKTYAVLTGDIVKSRRIANKARLMATLTGVLDAVTARYRAAYDLYRGDSFQIILPAASDAALVAILIRARLISCSPDKKERWDARIAIGFGGMTYRGRKITDSDGPAFQLSGTGVDELNKNRRRLLIKSPWSQTDRMLGLPTRFADDIITHWSTYSAETAYYSLLYDESQSALAQRLGKSQPTIHNRMATAKLDLIRAYIRHVSNYIEGEIRNDPA